MNLDDNLGSEQSLSNSEREKQNIEYLNKILKSDNKKDEPKEIISERFDAPKSDYIQIDISSLPTGKFYKSGTKISIRACKVAEIQSYSMVDDNNFVDITEKMNELLSKNVLFYHPNGTKGSYKDIKDSDRMFIIFMIREMTFQGGNTLTKEVTCPHCSNEFHIPFRATRGLETPITFEMQELSKDIEKFYNREENAYEIIHNNVSWRLGPPTIGIQEDFYDEIKRNVQADKKPDVAFMKIMPFLLYDVSSITPEGIKDKHKDFKNMNDLVLFQGLNEIVGKMQFGIKGLKMNCPQCGLEVRTELTFPKGASKLFELPNILDRFSK